MDRRGLTGEKPECILVVLSVHLGFGRRQGTFRLGPRRVVPNGIRLEARISSEDVHCRCLRGGKTGMSKDASFCSRTVPINLWSLSSSPGYRVCWEARRLKQSAPVLTSKLPSAGGGLGLSSALLAVLALQKVRQDDSCGGLWAQGFGQDVALRVLGVPRCRIVGLRLGSAFLDRPT